MARATSRFPHDSPESAGLTVFVPAPRHLAAMVKGRRYVAAEVG